MLRFRPLTPSVQMKASRSPFKPVIKLQVKTSIQTEQQAGIIHTHRINANVRMQIKSSFVLFLALHHTIRLGFVKPKIGVFRRLEKVLGFSYMYMNYYMKMYYFSFFFFFGATYREVIQDLQKENIHCKLMHMPYWTIGCTDIHLFIFLQLGVVDLSDLGEFGPVVRVLNGVVSGTAGRCCRRCRRRRSSALLRS